MIDISFDDAKIYEDLSSSSLLHNKLIVNIFAENSTRTKTSFAIASARLGARIIDIDINTSSTAKGESLYDTIITIDAMKPDAIVLRSNEIGLLDRLEAVVSCPIIDAGNSTRSHPTQALLDLFTIYKHFDGKLKNKNVAIVGDIIHSRVASSLLEILPKYGISPILVAPKQFIPQDTIHRSTNDINTIIDDIDVIIRLRTQTERHDDDCTYDKDQFAQQYCITKDMLGNRDIILLHPGPVMRNVDISDEMLQDPRCKVLDQVANGVAVRMAVLSRAILGS